MAAYGSLSFAEQIAFFRQKVNLGTQRWDDILGAAHDRSFVVAGAAKADLLADLRAAVTKAIEQGTTLAEFRKDFEALVARHGWTGWTGEGTAAGRAWRTRIIYETNLRASYAAGRWAQIQQVKAERPYLLYRHNDNVLHPRPLHVAWDGKVIAADDPWWRTHFPPNGWGCQCRVHAVDDAYLRKLGKAGPDPAPDDGTYDYFNKVSGVTLRDIPKGIDPGWDYAPGASVAGDLQRLQAIAAQKVAKAVSVPPPVPPAPTYWDPTTEDGRWHEAAFSSAPDWLKQAIRKAGTVKLIQPENRGAYQLRDSIHMGRHDMNAAHGQSTWRHEFGHFLDYKSGKVTYAYKSDDLIALMEDDAGDLLKGAGLGRKSKAQEARVVALRQSYLQAAADADLVDAESRLRKRASSLGLDYDRFRGLLRAHTEVMDGNNEQRKLAIVLNAIEERDGHGLLNALEMSDIGPNGVWGLPPSGARSRAFHKGSEGCLSDLFSAATRLKIEGSGGHGAAYYRDRGKPGQVKEVVANLTCLFGDAFGDQWQVIIDRLMPRISQAWREHLQQWGQ